MSASTNGAGIPPLVIPLWPGTPPGSEHWTHTEVAYLNEQGEQLLRNVVQPAFTAYLPDRTRATGAAVVIAPGGGFLFQSWATEGTQVAEWLCERGVAAFVLKYRLRDTGVTDEELREAVARLFRAQAPDERVGPPPGLRNPEPAAQEAITLAIADGRQAVALVRQRAVDWGIVPDRIGIMGFSAGARVTVGVALEHDATSRPDFIAPIYGAPFDGADVPVDAMPLFTLVADDDQLAAQACVALYAAWHAAGRSAELHVYAQGGHGFGMRKQGLPSDSWIERFYEWLRAQGRLETRA